MLSILLDALLTSIPDLFNTCNILTHFIPRQRKTQIYTYDVASRYLLYVVWHLTSVFIPFGGIIGLILTIPKINNYCCTKMARLKEKYLKKIICSIIVKICNNFIAANKIRGRISKKNLNRYLIRCNFTTLFANAKQAVLAWLTVTVLHYFKNDTWQGYAVKIFEHIKIGSYTEKTAKTYLEHIIQNENWAEAKKPEFYRALNKINSKPDFSRLALILAIWSVHNVSAYLLFITVPFYALNIIILSIYVMFDYRSSIMAIILCVPEITYPVAEIILKKTSKIIHFHSVFQTSLKRVGKLH